MRMTKKITIILLGFVLTGSLSVSGDDFADKKDKQSYCIGLDIGRNLLEGSIDINIEPFFQGFRDAYTEQEWKLTEEEVAKVIEEFSQEQYKKHMEKQQKIADENKAASSVFLEENARKEGVKLTESGIQYQELQPGTGKTPGPEDMVKVHYRGTLIDGTEFDSSYSRGEPAVFSLKQVIPGWAEAMQLMKEGAKFNVVIPSDLAYGANGAGGVIGPHATLIFDIELLEVNP